VRIIVDQQLPVVLAEWLRSSGHQAVHVREIGLKDASDVGIWTEARRDGAVVVSRDEDFVQLTRNPGGARLIWVRLGNCSNPALLDAVRNAWPELSARIASGEVLVEPRR